MVKISRKNYLYRKNASFAVLFAADIISVSLSMYLAHILTTLLFLSHLQSFFPPSVEKRYLIALTIILIAVERLYTKRLPLADETKQVYRAVLVSVAIALYTHLFLTADFAFSIAFESCVFALAGMFFIPGLRYYVKRLLHYRGVWKENVVILGAGIAGQQAADWLEKDDFLGYNPVCFLDDDPSLHGKDIDNGGRSLKVLGPIGSFKEHMTQFDSQTVLIAIPTLPAEKLTQLTNTIHKHARNILLIPELKGIPLMSIEPQHIFKDQLLMLNLKNNLKSGTSMFIKRVFDYLFVLLSAPVFLPLMVIFTVLIRLDSKGPALFKQDRMGRHGKNFKCFKFRTMYVNSDEILEKHLAENPEKRQEWEEYHKLKGDDPRITRIGHILRKTSLDELPQIFNVLRGEMSVVGPRPYMPSESGDMKGYINEILTTYPGITGLWQVSGRNTLTFQDRVQLDAWYSLNWSFWLDLLLVAKTIPVVIFRKGVY
ncbi:undecaprenyl-phosphate galactose phosphotransferase WbaP [Limisalsivibrio acetivorans]|uniref:undecaprenyl-phosphate galactose phosphotransferase WbaP n=1 Tax=Limisalsivibrio acetivorans TaxID=1304888 RepID=UPI0003B5B0A8|nr:undecaprenyl-phosphate galactose phosphotransferase WbaP [Limisalsivibrio acetivorans]